MHLETITELLNLPEVTVFQALECTDDAIYLLVVPVDESKLLSALTVAWFKALSI